MKLGLSSLLFVRSSIEDAVRTIAELGSECIEVIYDVPHFMPDHDPRQLGGLKELIDSYGLDIAVHGSFWDLNPASHCREIREFSLRQAKRSIEACKHLGGKILALHPGRAAIPELEWFMREANQRCLDFFEECSAFARESGVKLAIENIGLPYYTCSSLEELGEIVDGREELGITLDIGHAYRREKAAGIENPEQDLAEAIKRLGKKITHVHLHDNHGERDEHLVPGQGSIDYEQIVSALKAIG
ncbi:MAG: sugar phosphate isomerase/epimerase, partial [Hadesarchaea archaeon]|nr:sugar phosphate isomerase/epimerase [Hadesarchaea archaeon]